MNPSIGRNTGNITDVIYQESRANSNDRHCARKKLREEQRNWLLDVEATITNVFVTAWEHEGSHTLAHATVGRFYRPSLGSIKHDTLINDLITFGV